MTTDERIKEIEESRKHFCRVTDEDHDFLLALVKVQREALEDVASFYYRKVPPLCQKNHPDVKKCMCTKCIDSRVDAALNWKQEDV